MPETLDETYERVLKDINKANRKHARRLLQCLAAALRPLRVEELAEVLTMDFEHLQRGIPRSNPNWRWADQHQAVLSTCSSLIAIEDIGKSRVVQFSHFSVKEFLTSDRLARSSKDVSRYHIVLEPAHTILAQACLGVLLGLDDRVHKGNVGDIPLVEYAAQHWVDNARFENVALRLRDAMEYFFDADKPHWAAWCRVQMIDGSWPWFSPPDASPVASPLYYASLAGFYDLVKHLIGERPEQINTRGGLMVAPLVAALRRNHFQVAELLHRHGADIDVRGMGKRSLLYAACMHEYLDMMQWLFNHGADVDAQNDELWTALHSSANGSRVEVLKMLIERKADVHMRNDFGKSPLHIAAAPEGINRHVDVMQVLLDHGADPNARDGDNSTPLHHCSWWLKKDNNRELKGTVEGTRLLLGNGAIIDAEDNDGRTPLQLAMEHGNYDIARCISEHDTI